MNLRGRFDTATRAGRPAPMHDWRRLAFGFLPTTTVSAQYYNEDNVWRKLWLCLCNTTGSAVTVSAYLVTSGGSVGDQHAFLKSVPLEANETIFLPQEILVDQGEKLFLQASTGSAVTGMALVEMQG